MTWQAASFMVLGVALILGFAWYERSRPTAKVLALVACLAALTVVGRLAFAAFPNVKPTTDMVLLTGYSLGAAPGFAVGAIAPLVSNIVLTHGPWTPWQMAAWGGIGVAGAGLAWLVRGRELSRWTLALICGLFGFVFGAVMDTYQWTLAAEQTPAQWLAIASTSLPYNVAHAVGNVIFCLAIGPAFLRALTRYRRRFEVSWPQRPATQPAVVGTLLALVLAAPLVAPGAASASSSSRALDYLRSAQNADGGFGAAEGQRSTELHTGWAALGIASAGRNPREFQRGGNSVLDYMRSHAGDLRDIGDIQRTILVLDSARLSPREFGGRDLVAELRRARRRDGSFRRNVAWTTFGALALRAAGEKAGRSIRWLVRAQNRDGGWGVAPRSPSDVDDTAAVVQALAAGGRRGSRTVRRALRFLKRAQNSDGGFGQLPRRASNAQSTSWAVQGLVAAGRPRGKAARRALRFLRGLQRSDGSVRYSRSSTQTPVWVTAQALMAFEREAFPLASVALARARGGSAGGAPSERERRGERRKKDSNDEKEPAEEEAEPAPPTEPAPPSAPAAPAEPTAEQDGGEGGGGGDAAVVGALAGGALVVAGIWWRRRRRGPGDLAPGGPSTS